MPQRPLCVRSACGMSAGQGTRRASDGSYQVRWQDCGRTWELLTREHGLVWWMWEACQMAASLRAKCIAGTYAQRRGPDRGWWRRGRVGNLCPSKAPHKLHMEVHGSLRQKHWLGNSDDHEVNHVMPQGVRGNNCLKRNQR